MQCCYRANQSPWRKPGGGTGPTRNISHPLLPQRALMAASQVLNDERIQSSRMASASMVMSTVSPTTIPSFVQRAVPAHAEIMTVDGGRGYESCSCLRTLVLSIFPPGRLPWPQVGDIQRGTPGDPADREISCDAVVVAAQDLHLAAAESDLRMVVRIQEVGTAQVVVSAFVSRPDRLCIHPHFYGSTPRILRIEIPGFPARFLNAPLTKHTIMCRTANSAAVCPGSKYHFAIQDLLMISSFRSSSVTVRHPSVQVPDRGCVSSRTCLQGCGADGSTRLLHARY